VSLKATLFRVLPEPAIDVLRRVERSAAIRRVQRAPALSEGRFRSLLEAELRVRKGDVVFFHSSIDRLHLDFPFYRVLALLLETIGRDGTLLCPTYGSPSSRKYLMSGQVFDVRKTPSSMGILTELMRRHRDAVRSLHPTKSVCAIGPAARDLVGTHHLSPYPYDANSPYFRLMAYDAKIIGLGVKTKNLAFVHTVDDALKDAFPVDPYEPGVYEAPCRDERGERVVVKTLSHDPSRMDHDIPSFMKKHVSREAGEDRTIDGMHFFRVHARTLFDQMCELARRRTTIYADRVYRKAPSRQPPSLVPQDPR
jgi:aminoglycoside 3-N-acetyltransferase